MNEQIPEIPGKTILPEVYSEALLNKNRPIILLLVILGLVIVAGSVYAGMKIREKKQIPTPNSKITPSQTVPTVVPTIDPTARWKTYKNEKYGYEIKYPGDFVVNEKVGGKEVAFESNKWEGYQGNHPSIGITVDGTSLSLSDWLDKNQIYGPLIRDSGGKMFIYSGTAGEQQKGPVESITVGENKALKFYWWGVSAGGDNILVKNKSFLYHIYRHLAGALSNPEETVPKELFDQILSTFKFIE